MCLIFLTLNLNVMCWINDGNTLPFHTDIVNPKFSVNGFFLFHRKAVMITNDLAQSTVMLVN